MVFLGDPQQDRANERSCKDHKGTLVRSAQMEYQQSQQRNIGRAQQFNSGSKGKSPRISNIQQLEDNNIHAYRKT